MAEDFRTKVLQRILHLKESQVPRDVALPVCQNGNTVAWLDPLTWADVDRPEAIALLAQWREQAADSFPAQFPVTLAGTKQWLQKQVLALPDRMLFWVATPRGQRIGHVGLFRFDFAQRHVEIDNIMRGVAEALPGIIHAAVVTLLNWTFNALQMETVFLRVFSDNARAQRLYDRCGFQETMRMPLARTQEGDVARWVEVDGTYRQPVNRYFVTMRLPRARWLETGAAA
jgi:RimJ/RimL family protein N-acetyltransferase